MEKSEVVECSAIEAIRLMTVMFDPDKTKGLVARLAIVNLLARYIIGNADKDFVEKQLLLVGIKLSQSNKINLTD